MKVFSAKAFRVSETGKSLGTVLGSHIDILDGSPVQDAGDGFGRIMYEIDGEDWELYPVMPEWCEEDIQQSLF